VVGWSLPYVFLPSTQCNAHARFKNSSTLVRTAHIARPPSRGWEVLGKGPRLSGWILWIYPLYRGIRKDSKRLRPKSRVGRIQLVGWDPLKLLTYVPHSYCNARARFLQNLIRERASPCLSRSWQRRRPKGDAPSGFRRRAPGGKRLENRLDFWIYPCQGEKERKREVEIEDLQVGRILVWLVGRFPLNTLT